MGPAGTSAWPPKLLELQLYWIHEVDAVSPDSMAWHSAMPAAMLAASNMVPQGC